MIPDLPIARLTCTTCGETVRVYGDTRCTPDRQTFVCVLCLDPRQRAHDELVAAEAELGA